MPEEASQQESSRTSLFREDGNVDWDAAVGGSVKSDIQGTASLLPAPPKTSTPVTSLDYPTINESRAELTEIAAGVEVVNGKKVKRNKHLVNQDMWRTTLRHFQRRGEFFRAPLPYYYSVTKLKSDRNTVIFANVFAVSSM